ncbi:uncharacterized protein LOC116932016 isoform X4 [Daphnia magna]|uniref:uncharacterized protein LOC116932016 isoform X3 n=1 Tax=Daphnia magna TaxID=35525 RepID=UPI0006DF36D8|nr:uncharacterized protein LOC116932016 isoform X3 [Daphnia magna]XP_045029574.1 uncharacterized protein LOC116932016 isoform X4 [Daphnia magna]
MEIKAQEMLTIEYGDVYYLTCAEYSSLWFDHHLMPLISLSELNYSSHLPSLQNCHFNNLFSFDPIGSQATTLFSSSHRYKIHHQNYGLAVFFLRLRLIAVILYAFAFGSSLSSPTPSPLRHRCLRIVLRPRSSN